LRIIPKFKPSTYGTISPRKNNEGVIGIPNTDFSGRVNFVSELQKQETGAQRARIGFKQMLPWFGH